MQTHEAPPEFKDFLLHCDQSGLDPFTELSTRYHAQIDAKFQGLESKYRQGREGKSWADLAGEVYDDVKKGIDEVSKEAARMYYGNP